MHAGWSPTARHCELGPHGDGTHGLPTGRAVTTTGSIHLFTHILRYTTGTKKKKKTKREKKNNRLIK